MNWQWAGDGFLISFILDEKQQYEKNISTPRVSSFHYASNIRIILLWSKNQNLFNIEKLKDLKYQRSKESQKSTK